MRIQDVYQPYAYLDFDRLAFGVVVHHRNETFEQVELCSMEEDNSKIFSEVMSFEGVRVRESNVDDMLYGGKITPILVISKYPSSAVLFSPNFYFGMTNYENGSMLETVHADHELSPDVWANKSFQDGYIRPMRALLTDALVEKDSVYSVYKHRLSDLLDEANLEIKEYIKFWNHKKARAMEASSR